MDFAVSDLRVYFVRPEAAVESEQLAVRLVRLSELNLSLSSSSTQVRKEGDARSPEPWRGLPDEIASLENPMPSSSTC